MPPLYSDNWKSQPKLINTVKKWIPKNFLKLETKHEKLELNFDEKCSIVKKKELKKKPLDFTKLPKSNSVQKNTNCDKWQLSNKVLAFIFRFVKLWAINSKIKNWLFGENLCYDSFINYLTKWQGSSRICKGGNFLIVWSTSLTSDTDSYTWVNIFIKELVSILSRAK